MSCVRANVRAGRERIYVRKMQGSRFPVVLRFLSVCCLRCSFTHFFVMRSSAFRHSSPHCCGFVSLVILVPSVVGQLANSAISVSPTHRRSSQVKCPWRGNPVLLWNGAKKKESVRLEKGLTSTQMPANKVQWRSRYACRSEHRGTVARLSSFVRTRSAFCNNPLPES